MTRTTRTTRTTQENAAFPKSRSRRLNAWLAATISAFFLAHSCMGTALLFFPTMPKSLEFLLGLGVFALVIHIAMSIITTIEMLTDTERPPSTRKKGHQLKKWITGGLLVIAAGVHQAVQAMNPLSESGILSAPVALMGVVSILLCIHICTGLKSLTRDLGLSSGLRAPLRVIAIAVTVLVCLALVWLLYAVVF